MRKQVQYGNRCSRLTRCTFLISLVMLRLVATILIARVIGSTIVVLQRGVVRLTIVTRQTRHLVIAQRALISIHVLRRLGVHMMLSVSVRYSDTPSISPRS